MTRTTINKFSLLTLLLAISFTLQFCTATKKAGKDEAVIKSISYESDLKPIMVRSCTPCHFPENGRKKMFDTYEATKANIGDILTRVQLPVDDKLYMPFREKRPALSDEEIAMFKAWMKQGMGQ